MTTQQRTLDQRLQTRAQNGLQGQAATTTTDTVAAMLKQNWKAIQSTIPQHVTPERLTRIAVTVIANDQKLQQCTPLSLVGAIMQCVRFGFEPNTTGEAYLIPYRNKKNGGRMEARFQLGYIGVVQLAYRSGFVASVGATDVCEHDDYSFEYGPGRAPYVKKASGERGRTLYYFAWVNLTNGGFIWDYMTRAEVESHRDQFSKQPDGFGWTDNFDAMAKKTVLLKVLKLAPKSIEMQNALFVDNKPAPADPQRLDDVTAYVLPEDEMDGSTDDDAVAEPEQPAELEAPAPPEKPARTGSYAKAKGRSEEPVASPTASDPENRNADVAEIFDGPSETTVGPEEPDFTLDFDAVSNEQIEGAILTFTTREELVLFTKQNQKAISKLDPARRKTIIGYIEKHQKKLQ